MTMNGLVASLKGLIDLDETDSEGKPENRLGAPATSAEIESVERLYGVRLPADYRQFLTLHNGWVSFEYGERLLSTTDLLTRKVPDQAMLDDYASDGDPLPRKGLVVMAGEGRRFTVYDFGATPEPELVTYDIGPARRYPNFTAFLTTKRTTLEATTCSAKL